MRPPAQIDSAAPSGASAHPPRRPFSLLPTAWRRPSAAPRRPTHGAACGATCDPCGATCGPCGATCGPCDPACGAAHSPCCPPHSATHSPSDPAGWATCNSSARACGFSHFLTAAGHIDLPSLRFSYRRLFDRGAQISSADDNRGVISQAAPNRQRRRPGPRLCCRRPVLRRRHADPAARRETDSRPTQGGDKLPRLGVRGVEDGDQDRGV